MQQRTNVPRVEETFTLSGPNGSQEVAAYGVSSEPSVKFFAEGQARKFAVAKAKEAAPKGNPTEQDFQAEVRCIAVKGVTGGDLLIPVIKFNVPVPGKGFTGSSDHYIMTPRGDLFSLEVNLGALQEKAGEARGEARFDSIKRALLQGLTAS